MPSKDKPHHEPKKPKSTSAHPHKGHQAPTPPPHVSELLSRPPKPFPGAGS
ncbi:MAG: hypothetical protein ACXVGH_08250 [Mycobacteriales bacterium]